MIAIGSLLLVVAVSLTVTRVATVILTATGLSRQVARFQARSAFTGSGFTTSESEQVVNHPVRRRVVMTLMLFGNAGIVAVVSTLIIGFTRSGGQSTGIRLAMLVGGLLLLVTISRSGRVDRALTRTIRRLLSRFTDLETRDHADLLELAGDYAVSELVVRDEDWLAGRTLGDLALRDEGVVVLGLVRGGAYQGTPDAETLILPGDVLVVYGRGAGLSELDCRPPGPEGDRLHDVAVRRRGRHRSRR